MIDGRRIRWSTLAVAVVLAAVGCGVVACGVDGAAHPDVSARLVSASSFPAGVVATSVDGAGRSAVLADVVGAARSDSITPGDCVPTSLSADPRASAVLVGQLPNGSAGGTLTVVATRVTGPLSSVADIVEHCPTVVRTNAAGASSTIRQAVVSPTPAASVADVATLEIARTQTTGGSGSGGTGAGAVGVASKTLVAQRGDLRVYVVYRGVATAAAADADPEQVAAERTTDLDALFAASVRAAFG